MKTLFISILMMALLHTICVAWEPSVEDPSGLSIVEGKPWPGVGITMRVTSLEPGSPAQKSGLELGVHFFNNTDNFMDAHSNLAAINQRLLAGEAVELFILEPGPRRRVELRPLPISQPTSLAPQRTDDPDLQATLEAYAKRGRFDPDGSALVEFVTVAKALGIPTNGITRAIEEGHFVPSYQDLLRVYVEPQGMTCEQIIERSLASGIWRADQIEGKRRSMMRNIDRDCDRWRLSGDMDPDRVAAWNREFGTIRESTAKKFSETTGPEWFTIVSIAQRTRQQEAAYRQRRCDFTAGLATIVAGARIECRGGTEPTAVAVANNTAISNAQLRDGLGDPSNPVAMRLRLIADGEFAAFTRLHQDEIGDVSLFTDGDPDAFRRDQALVNGKRLLAGYAIARGRILGGCGETLTDLPVRSQGSSSTRTVSGITVRRDDWDFVTNHSVPSRLMPVVRSASNIEIILEKSRSADMRRVFATLKCSDPIRSKLEANALRYQ